MLLYNGHSLMGKPNTVSLLRPPQGGLVNTTHILGLEDEIMDNLGIILQQFVSR